MKKLICILTAVMLIFAVSCDGSTPAPKVPDDNTALKIIDAYSEFLFYIGGHQDDNRLEVSGNLNPQGSATVISDITNGEYTYKVGSYATLQPNGNVEIRMTYIKDTVTNTLLFEGYSTGSTPIPEHVVYNDVEYDLYSWMEQQNQAGEDEPPAQPEEITPVDDELAYEIIGDYQTFLGFIYAGWQNHSNKIDFTGDLDAYNGSATVNTDITFEIYTYNKGCYASISSNSDVEIRMDYIKNNTPNTLYFKGYIIDGGSAIPELVIYNDVKYDLYFWMQQQAQ